MRRILFAVNVVIAILLVAAVITFYWVFYRALPTTSGTIETLVTQPVEVGRDRLGVPFIKAQTLDDLWFVQGFTTAEDRMFQMDGLRRLAAGELSEIVGAAGLESDREARRMRMRRIAEQAYADATPADKTIFAAYVRGVNAYIETHRGREGAEFALLGYDPRPWSIVDSLLCGLQMFRTLTDNWETRIAKQQMLRGGDAARVNFLYPYRAGFETLPGDDSHPGSNAWAVSGAHSLTGKPLLSNDMHLDFEIPGVWYMDHLQGPGINVAGVALPGMPGIISGHNERIAWGETNLGFEVQDLYIEKMDLRTGRYLFQGKVEQARPERELIVIKGSQPEQMTTWVTRHGPVFRTADGAIMTLKWSAAERGVLQNIFPDIDRARNWDDFKRAISRFGGPSQNFVYADADGNIGYHASGKLPIRRNYNGDIPVDGSSGENEWDGYIPFDRLPEALNPPTGFIVTANQNPFPADYPYHVSGSFAAPWRSQQILSMLRASAKLKPEDGLRIQKDVYSSFDKFLAQQLVAAYHDRHGTSKVFDSVMAMLTRWDGQMDQNRPEPLVTTLTYQYLRKALGESASPGKGSAYDSRFATVRIEQLLRQRPSDWFGGDYNSLLMQCFVDAIDEGQRMQGGDPSRWRWGGYLYLRATNPIMGRLPAIGNYFNLGPIPLSGSSNTIKQTTRSMGPSERMNAAVGNWDLSLMNLPIGQSGHVASPHYRDQWNAYYTGQSFPMQFDRVDVKSKVEFVPAAGTKQR